MSSSSSSATITSKIFKAGHTAVITGASSGIGRAMAMYCASMGMHVWLVDVDETQLTIAMQLVNQTTLHPTTQKIQSMVVNVGDGKAMKDLARTVFADTTTQSVHYLMNNAGVGLGGGALSTSVEEFTSVMNVNLHGPIHGCQAFVPQMKSLGQHGLIINTGSKQGITMPPGNLTYNVSKAALKTWTEGLEHELRDDRFNAKGKLYSALLIPGWVNTSIRYNEQKARATMQSKEFDANKVFFHEEKPAKGAWMPQQVIEFMIQELNLGRFYIVCPDNDVDRATDNLRMTWTMQDITQNRAPLSRWHPDWKEKFNEYLLQTSKMNE